MKIINKLICLFTGHGELTEGYFCTCKRCGKLLGLRDLAHYVHVYEKKKVNIYERRR